MKRFVWLAIAALMLSLALPVFAQQDLKLEIVQVQFWPEFDQPSMLVIYTIELAEDTPLPANVTLQIPAYVGEPNAVAVDVSDRLLTTDYTREVNGDWADIVVAADATTVHVEYYDRGLSREGIEREFEFAWLGNYAVDELIIRVQAPVGATNMTFSEEMEGPQIANDGLGYYLQSFGPLGWGERFDFSMAYEKSDNTLSFDAMADLGILESPEETGLDGFLSNVPSWLWGLVGAGVVLIGMGGWSLISDRNKRAKKSQSSYKKKRSRAGSSGKVGKAAKFCHKCGAGAKSGDKFCRECGEKIRV